VAVQSDGSKKIVRVSGKKKKRQGFENYRSRYEIWRKR
jgi:hypothetical protein